MVGIEKYIDYSYRSFNKREHSAVPSYSPYRRYQFVQIRSMREHTKGLKKKSPRPTECYNIGTNQLNTKCTWRN